MARPHQLLIAVAAGRAIDPATVDLAVVESAVEHRMSGLLLAALGDAEAADHGIRARLEAIDMAATVQRDRLMRVAGSLHRKLEAEDIDHLFFKGVVEAHRLFDKPNHRPFADVDLCIRPGESLSEATAAIAPDFPNVDLLDALEAGGYLSSVSFFEDGQPVDLHTDVVRVGPGARHPELWWRNTVAFDLPELGIVRVLNREASFVAFVLHQARDRFRYLIGAAEYRLRLSEDLSFDAIRSLAEAEGLWDQVAVAMSVMSEDLGMPAPISMPNTIRSRQWQRLWKSDVRLAGPAGRYRHPRRSAWLMPVLARGRTASSLLWIARSAVPPDAQLRRKHPRARGPYLWRVVSSRVSHITRRRQQASRS